MRKEGIAHYGFLLLGPLRILKPRLADMHGTTGWTTLDHYDKKRRDMEMMEYLIIITQQVCGKQRDLYTERGQI